MLMLVIVYINDEIYNLPSDLMASFSGSKPANA